MSWLSDVWDFEKFQLKQWKNQIKENPEQLLIGAADPFGAELWSGITGKDYTPMVNEFGGPTEDTFTKAQEGGHYNDVSRNSHDAAKMVAAMYAGNGIANIGGGSAAGGQAGGWQGWAKRGLSMGNPGQQPKKNETDVLAMMVELQRQAEEERLAREEMERRAQPGMRPQR